MQQDFRSVFSEVLFESPYYDPAIGSVVHEDEHGEIDSAISVLPIPYRVNGQSIMGRLLCAFMMKPEMSPRGAAELTLTLRPSEKILNFTDSAAPVSLKHSEAIGGLHSAHMDSDGHAYSGLPAMWPVTLQNGVQSSADGQQAQ